MYIFKKARNRKIVVLKAVSKVGDSVNWSLVVYIQDGGKKKQVSLIAFL